MNDSLRLIYEILTRFLDFMFSAYIFDGVSLGMVLLLVGLFIVLLGYIVAIPKMRVGDYRPTVTTSRSYNTTDGRHVTISNSRRM